ncbi:MAG TPA: TetR family transcriptional regulator C-terminal domain-containing protein [Streptosporangiaceae bacterium]|nr:TetR family transcriptional regulator C-terminal domain-containing protein [Streptosporangiaceae bacterium]
MKGIAGMPDRAGDGAENGHPDHVGNDHGGNDHGGTADQRRAQMLHAALEIISERGYADTRIADVAERAGVSPALVIYYFKTKDHLLTEAIRYYEDHWYEVGKRRMTEMTSAAARIEEIVAMSCLAEADPEPGTSWSLWLDFWAQAARNPEVASVRQKSDERWRDLISELVLAGQEGGEFRQIDPGTFAISLSTLLDGLTIQIALDDPVVDSVGAFELSMQFVAEQLGFSWTPGRGREAGREQKAQRQKAD